MPTRHLPTNLHTPTYLHTFRYYIYTHTYKQQQEKKPGWVRQQASASLFESNQTVRHPTFTADGTCQPMAIIAAAPMPLSPTHTPEPLNPFSPTHQTLLSTEDKLLQDWIIDSYRYGDLEPL